MKAADTNEITMYQIQSQIIAHNRSFECNVVSIMCNSSFLPKSINGILFVPFQYFYKK